MPFYHWVDNKNKFEVQVIRSFKEYDVPPQDDEIPEEMRDKEHEWERLISEMSFVSKWPSSGGPVKGRA